MIASYKRGLFLDDIGLRDSSPAKNSSLFLLPLRWLVRERASTSPQPRLPVSSKPARGFVDPRY